MGADVLFTVGIDEASLQASARTAASTLGNIKLGGINANSYVEPLGRITGKASEFSKSMEASNARVLAFGASAGAIYAVHKSFEMLLSSTIEVQKSMNLLGTLFNVSNTTLKGFSNSLFEVANLTGQTFKAATEAANTFARQGLSASETLIRTRDALILARIAGMDFSDAARVITTAINSFNKEALSSTEIINALSAAETHFSVNASSLAEAISRVGTSAENANVTLDQTIALVTSAAQITGRSGSVIGNSFKSIFTRLERPKVLDDLQEIGVVTKDASGNILPLVDVLKNLAGTYDLLTPSQKSFITEAVGGVYQINTLKAVLGDLGSGFSVYDRVLKTVTNSTSSVIDRNNQLNETISSKLNATLNNLIETASKVGNIVIAPQLGKGADMGANFFKGLSDMIDADSLGGEITRGVLKGIGGALSGPGVQLITFTMLSLFKNLTSFAAKAVGDLTGLNVPGKLRAVTESSVAQTLIREHETIQSMIAQGKSEIEIKTEILRLSLAYNTSLIETAKYVKDIASFAGTNNIAVLPTGGDLTSKGIPRASGYIPNFNDEFSIEEVHAKSLGASAPRAHYGRGTIGGKQFIMNSQETEIPNFGSNGDSAVIPHYSKGHVPNFAHIPFLTPMVGRLLTNTIDPTGYAIQDKIGSMQELGIKKLMQAMFLDKDVRPADMMQDIASKGRIFPFRQMFGLKSRKTAADIYSKNKDGSYSFNSKNDIGASLLHHVYMNDFIHEGNHMAQMRQDLPISGTAAWHPVMANYNKTLTDKTVSYKDTWDFAANGPEDKVNVRKLAEQAHATLTGYRANRKQGLKRSDAFIMAMRQAETNFSYGESSGSTTGQLSRLARTLIGAVTSPIQIAGEFDRSQVKNFYADGYIPRSEIYNVPFRTMVRGRQRPVAPDEIGDRFREYENYLLNAALPKLGFEGIQDLNNVFGSNARADFFARKTGNPYVIDAKAGYNDAQQSDIAVKEHSFSKMLHEPEYVQYFQKQGVVDMNDIRSAMVFGNMGHQQKKTLSKTGRLMAAAGLVPNFAEIFFNHAYDKISDTSTLSGYVGNEKAGTLEYGTDKKGIKEIENFTMNGGFKGKGLAKHFYKALGQGRVSGIMLPQFDKGGNAYFPQLSRARMAKEASIERWGQGQTVAETLKRIKEGESGPISLSQFEELVKTHKGNKDFWGSNSFSLNTLHASGFFPNFADDRTREQKIRELMERGATPGERSAAAAALQRATSLGGVEREFLIANKEAIMGGMGKGLGQSFNIDALAMGDIDYATKTGLPRGIAEVLARIVKKQGGKEALKRLLRDSEFAAGHIPNFSSLDDAVGREMGAGYSSSQIRVGRDSSLATGFNPQGLGVYNSTEGSLSHGISLARRAGIEPKTKGMAAGGIPNFADMGGSMMMGLMQFAMVMPMATEGLAKMGIGTKQSAESLAKLKAEETIAAEKIVTLNKAIASISDNISSFATRIAEAERNLIVKAQGLRVTPTALPVQAAKNQLAALQNQKSMLVEEHGNLLNDKIKLENQFASIQKQQQPPNPMFQGLGFGKSMGISIGASMIGGVGEEMLPTLGASKDSAKGFGNFANSFSTAAQAAIIPVIGPMVAGGIAFYGAMNFVDKMAYGFAEKLKADTDVKLTGIDKMDAASNALSQTMSHYSALLDDSHSTTAALLKAKGKYEAGLADLAASGISQETMGKITGAGTMQEKMAALEDANDARNQEKQKLILTKNTADLAEQLNTRNKSDTLGVGIGTLVGGAAGTLFGPAGTVAGGVAGAYLGKGVSQLIKGGDANIFDDKYKEKGGGTELLSQMTEQAVALGKGSGKYIQEMTETLHLSDDAASMLSQNVSLTKLYVAAQEKLGKVLDTQIGSARAAQQAMEGWRTSLKQLSDGMRTFAGDTYLQALGNIPERMKTGAAANMGDVNLASAAALSLNNQFGIGRDGKMMNKDREASIESQNSVNKVQAGWQEATTGIEANYQKGVMSIIQETLSRKGEGANDKGQATNQANATDEDRNAAAKDAYDIIQNVKNTLPNLNGTDQTKVIRDRFTNLSKVYSGEGKTGLSATISTLATNLDESKISALGTQKTEDYLKQGVEWAEKSAMNLIEAKNSLYKILEQRTLSAGGGISSFTQDFDAGYRRNLRRDFAESRSSIPEVAGKGSIGILKDAVNDLGIGKGNPMYDSLIQKAVSGREFALQKDINVYAGNGIDTSGVDIHAIAQDQVEKEVGAESSDDIQNDIKNNSDKTNDILTQILEKNGIINSQSSQQYINNQVASFAQSLLSGHALQGMVTTVGQNADTGTREAIEDVAARMSDVRNQLVNVSTDIQNSQKAIDDATTKIDTNTPEGIAVQNLADAIKALITQLSNKTQSNPTPVAPSGRSHGTSGGGK